MLGTSNKHKSNGKFKYPSQGRFNSRKEHYVALRQEGEIMLRAQLVQDTDQ